VLALEESLRLIEGEGLAAIHERHARHSEACRAVGETLGLTLFSERPAHGLTAFRAPEGKDAQEVVKHLIEEHGMRIAGGQEPMKGKLFRIGHMGYYTDADILDVVEALERTLRALAWTEASGARERAARVLAGDRESRTLSA
jgi:aspartate aminotransferase-like enzyme